MRITIEIDATTAMRLTEAAVAARRPLAMQAAVALECALEHALAGPARRWAHRGRCLMRKPDNLTVNVEHEPDPVRAAGALVLVLTWAAERRGDPKRSKAAREGVRDA